MASSKELDDGMAGILSGIYDNEISQTVRMYQKQLEPDFPGISDSLRKCYFFVKGWLYKSGIEFEITESQ